MTKIYAFSFALKYKTPSPLKNLKGASKRNSTYSDFNCFQSSISGLHWKHYAYPSSFSELMISRGWPDVQGGADHLMALELHHPVLRATKTGALGGWYRCESGVVVASPPFTLCL